MDNYTQGNKSRQIAIFQERQLSFYEENYILEPEDYEKDNGYFMYEGDASAEYLTLMSN
jgi:hypothetical protein